MRIDLEGLGCTHPFRLWCLPALPRCNKTMRSVLPATYLGQLMAADQPVCPDKWSEPLAVSFFLPLDSIEPLAVSFCNWIQSWASEVSPEILQNKLQLFSSERRKSALQVSRSEKPGPGWQSRYYLKIRVQAWSPWTSPFELSHDIRPRIHIHSPFEVSAHAIFVLNQRKTVVLLTKLITQCEVTFEG